MTGGVNLDCLEALPKGIEMKKLLDFLLLYRFNMIDLAGQLWVLYMYMLTDNWMWFLWSLAIGAVIALLQSIRRVVWSEND